MVAAVGACSANRGQAMGRTQLPLCLLAALVCLLARADAYDLLQFRQ